jgi:hypothetical protein
LLFGWLVGCLVGWLVCCLVGWLGTNDGRSSKCKKKRGKSHEKLNKH